MSTIPQVLPRNFQAEWPEELKPNIVTQAAWKVFSVLFFAVDVVRKQIVANLVVPALQHVNEPYFDQRRQELVTHQGGERISFMTPDGETLDGMIFKGTVPGKAVLFATGNGGTYETSEDYIKMLKETGATVMVFNRRGVLNSSGFPWRQGLALDVYSAYEYLDKVQGIAPEYVAGYGLSLGGSDINRGAAIVQKKYADRQIKVVNDRSFSDFATVAGSFASKIVGLPGINFLARSLVNILGLQMDSKDAWDSLKGRKCIIYHKLDGVVDYDSSLYKAVKKDNKSTVSRIRMTQPAGTRELYTAYHNRMMNPLEQKAIIREIRLMLDIPKYDAPDPAADALQKYLKHRN